MRQVLALDIETTGLDPWRDTIHMVGLWDGKTYLCIRTPEQLRSSLLTLYKDFDIVGHNTGFDLKFLEVQGWLPEGFYSRTIHDTKIIGSLVKDRVPEAFLEQYEEQRKIMNKSLPKGQSHREGSPLSLKVMAPWYLKVPSFWETPGDHNNEEYNQKDCMYTYRLYQLLAPRLQAEGSWAFYTERMLKWSEMIREMEITGIAISVEELDKLEIEYLAKRDDLKKKLDNLWMGAHHTHKLNVEKEIADRYGEMCNLQLAKGKDPQKTKDKYAKLYQKAMSRLQVEDLKINYASPAQMAWLLRDFLKLDIENAEGEESTGKAVLNKLAQAGREDIQTYLDWREADKVLTMYIPTYKELHVDGVIHPSFNLTGTRTGRLSSSNPNLQQVPPKLYRLFKPRSGYNFIQYDLSGIEAALIALYSGDKTLYDILDKGESIHDHNAIAMFGLDCTPAEVSSKYPKQRKTVKNIGFACFYGAGWRRISQVFAAGGFPITDAEAKAKLQLLKSYYPQVFEFHREITEIFEAGETVINLLGRPINLQKHDNVYMTGFNTLIQSSGSDINVHACEKFWDACKKHGDTAKPLLLIHDCVIAEAKVAGADDVAEHLVNCMTDYKLESVNGPIQLRVEGGVSSAWEK